MAGLFLGFLTACSSPSAQNRKVYDRYAELVAERNRTMNSATLNGSSTPVKDVPSRLAPAPVVTPVAPPVVKPTPTPGSASVAKPDATVKPTTVAPPPVQVIVPKPVEKVSPRPSPVSVPPKSTPVVSPEPAKPVIPTQPPVGIAPPGGVPAAPAPYVVSPSTDGVAYMLKVGDVVQVYLRGIPTADAIEDVIDEAGMISLPLINEIQAAGMTASELERNIRKTYLDQDIYRNIAVNVVVPTRYYFIQGEIRQPGRFQIVSAMRVSQAIAAAGGYTEYASGQVLVKRGGQIVKTIRNSRRLERTPEDDVLLEPDDIIEVRRSLW